MNKNPVFQPALFWPSPGANEEKNIGVSCTGGIYTHFYLIFYMVSSSFITVNAFKT